MAPLITRGVAAILALSTAPAMAQQARSPIASMPSIERWRSVIAEASRCFGVPETWIEAVMEAESGGHTHRNGRPIVSRAGAMGLMQLMPGTWAAMRDRHGLGSNPHDPRDNIMAGTAYLRVMYDSFGYPGLFAAYNAGPGRYSEHLRTGRPLPSETRGYIKQLAGTPASPSMPSAIQSGTRLFFALRPMSKSVGEAGPAPAHGTIITPLGQVAEVPR